MDELAQVLAALDWPAPIRGERMPGFDATVWRAEVGERTVAVRLLRPGRPCAGEVAMMRAAREITSAVPEVLATGSHQGRDVVIMSWCSGRPIGELLRADGDLDRLGELFGSAQAELNRAGICHRDFQPFNVLVDGHTVTGIVDWALARRDEAAADVARTRVILELAPALLPAAGADLIAAFRVAWERGYRAVAALPDDAELAPYAADAAEVQHADWAARAADGEVPDGVAVAARQIADRWRSLAG